VVSRRVQESFREPTDCIVIVTRAVLAGGLRELTVGRMIGPSTPRRSDLADHWSVKPPARDKSTPPGMRKLVAKDLVSTSSVNRSPCTVESLHPSVRTRWRESALIRSEKASRSRSISGPASHRANHSAASRWCQSRVR
jgi:hypothetical protein